MNTKKRTQIGFQGRLLRLVAVIALAAPLIGPLPHVPPVQAAELPLYTDQYSITITSASPTLTAVDPLAWSMFGDVLPARPFLYSVDQNGITITRFNDNKVVGSWPWPDTIWIELPDGSITEITRPAGGWEPVAMTVSYPTETEIANRVKEIPDLTPPWTFVYVVMAHSGYEWRSIPDPGRLQSLNVRDALAPMTSAETESSMLVQINVSDPSFSTWNDPVAPTGPHIAGAILGHGAGQPVYDRKTGNVYVGNQPSNSLLAGLTSFVSVIHRIPPEVTAEEPEVPGISKPVIRCGPQHPEVGLPVGRPQAYACYDPSGAHPINDNEHVGAFGEIKQWDATNPDLLQEQFVWEFRNLPPWLTPHIDLVSGEPDGILYGTPPTTGEWFAEARVHNLGDEFGVFSDWHPIRLLVTPTAEYLPIKAQFAAGVPVAYPLEGTGSCTLSGAPAWVDVQPVPNGCVVMGRAPISGEYYEFTMPGFRETGYPNNPIVFSGNVVGAYNFVSLNEGVGISGLAWHQVEKYADPSTEIPVLTGEFIGVDPSTGQLYRILQAPGQPQPPNERPAETAIQIDTVSAEGNPLPGSGFGEVAVEADRDIYVAAAGAVIKVSGGAATSISLPEGMQAASLSLDSDLRTAIPGVEPGQTDHGVLWVAGSNKAAVINTDAATLAYSFDVSGASSVSADFSTQYAYVATGSASIAIFGPSGRPPQAPRIWSSEEITWNLGLASIAEGPFKVMATGDLPMTLELLGELPDGINFVDNGDGTATIWGVPASTGAGRGCGGDPGGEGDPEGGDPCGDYAFTLTATNAYGVYAQALGMSVNITPTIDSEPTATFYTGSTSSFTVFGTGYPTPIFFTWDKAILEAAGVQLVDNENGTASLVGTPTTPGTYTFLIEATTGCPPDAQQTFTLIVKDGSSAPEITSLSTTTWEVIGAPFAPDPFTVTSIGSPTPTLSVSGTLPPGVTFIDNGDSTATFGGDCQVVWPGMDPSCLGVLPAAADGAWTFDIIASNGVAPDAIQTFTLVVDVATSIMTPPPTAPASLSFVYTPGVPPPAQIFSARTLGDTIPYATVTTADWLEATPVNGMVGPALGDLSVSVDPSGLAPGTYTGSVLVTSAGTDGPFATALVTLTVVDVSAPGELGIFPGALRFEYNVNDGILPRAQSVLVMSGGVPLDYTVSTGGVKWLSAPAGGTAPGVFSVSVNPRVGVGMHIASLTVNTNDPLYGPQTQIIPVTLVKTAGYADLVQVMFDVGSAPEGLAINLSTHNLFTTSSNAAAEAAEAAGVNFLEIETAGPPEPSLVYHVNPVDKTLLGQIVVHSQGEYIGVNSATGIAYQASQGTGEVAVIDGSTNSVLGFIPLVLDGGVYMPYQFAIDEAQNLIYVGAKSPEPEPNALIGPPYGCKAIRELPSDEAPAGQEELDCWHAGAVFVIDGKTNTIVGSFLAGDDPEGVVFANAVGKVYASNEDDGTITVASAARRNPDGSITPPVVLSTIIGGVPIPGRWQPTCDANNYCGQRGQGTNLSLWPAASACRGIDDEAEEADKMAVDPSGNVYVTDDRYRVAKIDGKTDKVVSVLAIPGYDCERSVPDDSPVVFRNTANNIAFMALGQGKLYVVSEQNTVTLIEWYKKGKEMLPKLTTITIPGAVELDAITTDRSLNRVYITDESLASLWILKGACANGVGKYCVP